MRAWLAASCAPMNMVVSSACSGPRLRVFVHEHSDQAIGDALRALRIGIGVPDHERVEAPHFIGVATGSGTLMSMAAATARRVAQVLLAGDARRESACSRAAAESRAAVPGCRRASPDRRCSGTRAGAATPSVVDDLYSFGRKRTRSQPVTIESRDRRDHHQRRRRIPRGSRAANCVSSISESSRFGGDDLDADWSCDIARCWEARPGD